MKDLVTMPDGTRGYKDSIEGYEFGVIELPSGYISFQAPMGEGEDKEMFDTLVYHNRGLYNGMIWEKETIKNRLSTFILQYKQMKENERVLAD